MKRLLMGLVLLMTATAASAEWTDVGESVNYIQYVDRATIRRDGNFVKMWDLADFKTVKKGPSVSYLSGKTQHEYDCKEEKKRILALTLLDGKMGSEKAVYLDGNVRDEWSPISPESIAEELWKVACGKK